MKTKIFLTMGALIGSLLSLCAQTPLPPAYAANYRHLVKVEWVLRTQDNLNADDRWVTLIGKVLGRAGSDYWFGDGTGQVRLDPGDFELPIGKTIIVGGRIDQAYLGIGHLEVNVKRWEPYLGK